MSKFLGLKKQCKGLHTASWEEISYVSKHHSPKYYFPSCKFA